MEVGLGDAFPGRLRVCGRGEGVAGSWKAGRNRHECFQEKLLYTVESKIVLPKWSSRGFLKGVIYPLENRRVGERRGAISSDGKVSFAPSDGRKDTLLRESQEEMAQEEAVRRKEAYVKKQGGTYILCSSAILLLSRC